MDSKTMLEGILWDLKVLTDLELHGTIESQTKKVHKAFKDSLVESLSLQNELYTLMSDKGMYATTNVAETKIAKAKNKFTETLEGE